MLDTTDYNPHGPFGDQTECNYKRPENRHSFRFLYAIQGHRYWVCEICGCKACYLNITQRYVYWPTGDSTTEGEYQLPTCIPIVVD